MYMYRSGRSTRHLSRLCSRVSLRAEIGVKIADGRPRCEIMPGDLNLKYERVTLRVYFSALRLYILTVVVCLGNRLNQIHVLARVVLFASPAAPGSCKWWITNGAAYGYAGEKCRKKKRFATPSTTHYTRTMCQSPLAVVCTSRSSDSP